MQVARARRPWTSFIVEWCGTSAEQARAKKIPISHLPDRAAVARSHFWEVLAWRTSPTLTWLGRVAAALEVDVEALVTRPQRAKLRT
jgi:hypothetical protein